MWESTSYTDTKILFDRLLSVVLYTYMIYFGSGGSCSYSSVDPPGGGCCTVCSHLVPAEVSLSYNDGLSQN